MFEPIRETDVLDLTEFGKEGANFLCIGTSGKSGNEKLEEHMQIKE